MISFLIPICFIAASVILLSGRFIQRRVSHNRLQRQWKCQQPVQVPGGPLGIKTLNGLRKAHLENQIAHHMQGLHRDYGSTIGLQAFGTAFTLTMDPENLQAILSTQFSDFGMAPFRKNKWSPLLGNGIFTSDGRTWEHSRRLLRPQFAKDQLPTLAWFDRHADNFLSALPRTDRSFDIRPLLFRYGLDTATDFLFDESVDSLNSPFKNATGVPETSFPGHQGFGEAFEYAQHILFQRSVAFSLYWLISPPRFHEANRVVHKFAGYFTDKAHQPTAKNGSKYSYLKAIADHPEGRNGTRDQITNILVAGRDNTPSLLSSVIYFLARDHRVWGKLREEVIRITESEGHKDLTINDIQSLKYLSWVVNEALRLFPPVPINIRIALKDTTLPVGGGPHGRDPVFIPKGHPISYSVWSLHRRPDIWGEDAEVFRPERWEGCKPGTWEFLPFNGGPRVCLGQQFAIMQVCHLVFRIAQKYDTLENASTGPDMGCHPPMHQTLTMSHAHEVNVRLLRTN